MKNLKIPPETQKLILSLDNITAGKLVKEAVKLKDSMTDGVDFKSSLSPLEEAAFALFKHQIELDFNIWSSKSKTAKLNGAKNKGKSSTNIDAISANIGSRKTRNNHKNNSFNRLRDDNIGCFDLSTLYGTYIYKDNYECNTKCKLYNTCIYYVPKKVHRFKKPSVSELNEYIKEKGYMVDAEQFYDYYESTGWKVGRKKMVSWKHALSYWHKNAEKRKQQQSLFGNKFSYKGETNKHKDF